MPLQRHIARMPAMQKDFFKVPHPGLWVAVVSGLAAFEVVAFQPHLFPYDSLGAAGAFIRTLAYDYPTLMQAGFAVACALHLGEGLYAYLIAKKAGLSTAALWGLQTVIVGFPSTKIIHGYVKSLKGDRPKKQR